MIFYHQYPPGPRLSSLVECYWVYRSSGNSGEEERLIPGGRVEMIFHFGTSFHWLIHPEIPEGNRISKVHFMGQRDRVYFGRPAGSTDMLGIRFRPGGLAAFTALPVSQLLNKMVPAEEVLGAAIQSWEERLQEQTGDGERILLLEQLLTGLLRDLPIDQAIVNSALTLIREHPDETSIYTICRQTGWYYKKLERAFKGTIGYTPKQYCRIIRFNAAIRQIGQYKKISPYKNAPLTKLSYACGYYDQSHFIRDFHRYAGTAPGSFQPGRHTIADFLLRYQPV